MAQRTTAASSAGSGAHRSATASSQQRAAQTPPSSQVGGSAPASGELRWHAERLLASSPQAFEAATSARQSAAAARAGSQPGETGVTPLQPNRSAAQENQASSAVAQPDRAASVESSFAWPSHAEVSSSVQVVQSLTDWQSGSAAEEQPAQASKGSHGSERDVRAAREDCGGPAVAVVPRLTTGWTVPAIDTSFVSAAR